MLPLRHRIVRPWLAAVGLGLTAPAWAAHSPLIVGLVINGTPQGDLIIQQDEAGRYYLPWAEFAELAQLPAQTPIIEIDGEPHVAADAIPGTELRFDPETLSLALTLPAMAFAPQHFSLARHSRRRSPLSSDNSLLLNYRLDAFSGDSREGWQLRSDQAWRRGDWLLSNDQLVTAFDGRQRSVRLLSQARMEAPASMRRLVLGDQRGRAGDALGSSQIIGGITLGRAFELAPSLIQFPTASISASTTSPADIELYVGEDRVFRGAVEPGPFQVADFNYYGGLQTLRLLIREADGSQQLIERPHYFASRGLAAGLSDYEWRLGFVRENPGSRSNDYGELVIGGFHRYGISDRLTAGVRLQLGEEALNAGASALYTHPRLGLVGLTTAFSQLQGSGRGGAINLEYQLQAGPFNALLFTRWVEPRYRAFGQSAEQADRGDQRGGSLSLGTRRFGTFTVSASRRQVDGEPQTDLRLSAGRGFPSGWSVDLSASRRDGPLPDRELLLRVRYRLGQRLTAASSVGRAPGTDRQWQLQAFSDRPHGPGLSWGAAASGQRLDGRSSGQEQLELRYQARYASLEAAHSEIHNAGSDAHSSRLGAAGSLAWVNGRPGVSREVNDAFALVEIHPPLAGVRVYHNNRPVGRSDAAGRLFVPSLTSLIDNVVSIDHRDIPFHYNIDGVEQALAPHPRGGSLLRYSLRAVRAITGTLVHAGSGQALEHRQFTLDTTAGPRTFSTGYDGRLYIENLPAGDYAARLEYANMTCTFRLRVPAGNEPFVELGILNVCDARDDE